MNIWTRRDLAKAGLALSTTGLTSGMSAETQTPQLNMSSSSPILPIQRERLLMDRGWRFALGHASDPDKDFGFGHLYDQATYGKSGEAGGPAGVHLHETFDDSSWKIVNLPHDWAVELPFVLQSELVWHGGKPLGRKYPGTSVGWYRKTFEIPASDLGKRITLEFDGIMRDAIVFVNGHYLDTNFSGYAPPNFDITDFLNYGASNLITVRCDCSFAEGWFYEGAGIYRHVWLNKTSAVHVAQWGSYVQSTLNGASASLALTTEVANDSPASTNCSVRFTVLDAQNRSVATALATAQTIDSGAKATFASHATLKNAALWSPDTPSLYTLVATVEQTGKEIDTYSTTFGVRSIRFDVDKGFFLNGKRFKIRGTCNHQDHAGVGAAIPDRLQYYRIELLKQMGSNAIRTSHNPPTPELLEACDRLGMVVMDEVRQFSSGPEGLSELERMARRDRNHPSVVLWSIANEERQQGTERGARIGLTMKRFLQRLDPTRPVTAAMSAGWGDGLSTIVDVQGFNYNEKKVDAYRAAHPHQPLIGSEVASITSTRGVYADDAAKGYVTSYKSNAWIKFYEDRDWLAGGFAWTGFDYRGEPHPYHLPCISSHFGLMDTCGFPKDNYFFYKAWWSGQPLLHILPHWTWPGKEGEIVQVWCYSNQETVELFLNGKSLGTQKVVPHDRLVWKVPYTPGVIEARASSGGKVVLTERRETTGAATKIVLTTDRSSIHGDGEDLAVVKLEIQDAAGRPAPDANHKIMFALEGPAHFLGVGNGDPSCLEPDYPTSSTTATRSAFNGLCMALIQAGTSAGEIRVTAQAAGLAAATTTVMVQPGNPRPGIG